MRLGLDQVLIYAGGSLQRGVSFTEIPDDSGGILICGSCIERFDPSSIFNKLASNMDCLRVSAGGNFIALLRTAPIFA